jgi:hypothetical protein
MKVNDGETLPSFASTAVLMIGAPVGALLCHAVCRAVANTPKQRRRVAAVGAVLAAVFLTATAVGLARDVRGAFGSPFAAPSDDAQLAVTVAASLLAGWAVGQFLIPAAWDDLSAIDNMLLLHKCVAGVAIALSPAPQGELPESFAPLVIHNVFDGAIAAAEEPNVANVTWRDCIAVTLLLHAPQYVTFAVLRGQPFADTAVVVAQAFGSCNMFARSVYLLLEGAADLGRALTFAIFAPLVAVTIMVL